MTKLKRILAALAIGTLALGVFGCGGDEKQAPAAGESVRVGVTAGPHAEIMDEVKRLAAKEGLNVEVVEFNDFVTPNIALYRTNPILTLLWRKNPNLIWSKFLKP